MEIRKRENITDLAVAAQIFADFFKSSNVGLATVDQQFRNRALNSCLAAYHRVPTEEHLGKHIAEILGKPFALQVEPALARVFSTARPVINHAVAGAFPSRPRPGRWMDNIFPMTDSSGTVQLVGVIVIEMDGEIEVQHNGRMLAAQPVLLSWKEIATYTRACIKTVQRWESSGFPVRRVTAKKGAVVFAFKDEVNAWLRSRATSSMSQRNGY